jgi:mono/diheme cytochrome c family protein
VKIEQWERPAAALAGDMRVLARSGGRMKTTTFLNMLCLLLAPISLTLSPLYAQDYPPDRARGKTVYEQHCQNCHGSSGRGDGPDAASMRVPPANFQRFQSFLKSDEELLRTIEHGIVFSPMHSWRGRLTDGEMQDVVAYIRLLSQRGR